jgi:type VI secretion system protein ImpC
MDARKTIESSIAEIDRKLSAQINEILHHPDFQCLEATWRALHYLVHQTETGVELNIFVLNITKAELLRDMEKAAGIEQSVLFRKVNEEEGGMLSGGKPWHLLVGDYEFSHCAEDIRLLTMISQVAAFAHAPFVAAASPKMLNMERFEELSRPGDLAKILSSVDHAAWKSFRESEDSRYVALTLPRVLARLPYGSNSNIVSEFDFEESVDGPNHDNYAWMSSAWVYAARVTDAFAKYGWLARIRGVEGGGRVEGLPVHPFRDERGDISRTGSTEVVFNERREFELSNLGLLPLLHCWDTSTAVFMGANSCQKPQRSSDPHANAMAELLTKLNLLLCASRFMHYVKILARNRMESSMDPAQCEGWLNEWIGNYVMSPADADAMKFERPLAEASVRIKPVGGKPGWHELVLMIKPRLQLEALSAALRLVAEIPLSPQVEPGPPEKSATSLEPKRAWWKIW